MEIIPPNSYIIFTQFIQFSIVGVINTAIHYSVFYILYQYLGVYHLFASAIGFGFAVTNSYYLNKLWTFKRIKANYNNIVFVKFLIVNLISLSINLASLAFLVELFDMDPRMAQLISISFTLLVNFFGNKIWTFKESSINNGSE